MNQDELDVVLGAPLHAVAASARAYGDQLLDKLEQQAETAARALATQRDALDEQATDWERRAAEIHVSITRMNASRSELERELHGAQITREAAEDEVKRLHASVADLRTRLAAADQAREQATQEREFARAHARAAGERAAEAERARDLASQAHDEALARAEREAERADAAEAQFAAFPAEIRSISERLAALAGRVPATDTVHEQARQAEETARREAEEDTRRKAEETARREAEETAGNRWRVARIAATDARASVARAEAAPRHAAHARLLPVQQATTSSSALAVTASQQVGTYWIPGASTRAILNDAANWVLGDGRGGRREGIPAPWTAQRLIAGGDFTNDDVLVRVRTSADANRWVLHFAHADRSHPADTWHQAFEAFEDGDGVTVRHLGGKETPPGFVGPALTPPRFVVKELGTRANGPRRHGSQYRADTVNVLTAVDVNQNFLQELVAINRHYAVVLVGARCRVPMDYWNTQPGSPEPRFPERGLPSAPGAVLFRVASKEAWEAVELAVRACLDETYDGHRDYGDLRSVLFVGRTGVDARWTEQFGSRFGTRKELRRAVTDVLLTHDTRWRHVMAELSGSMVEAPP